MRAGPTRLREEKPDTQGSETRRRLAALHPSHLPIQRDSRDQGTLVACTLNGMRSTEV